MQTTTIFARAAMLIRRPAPEAFEAFVNPAITTKFWFTKSSGRLEAGKQVKWDWQMYNVSSLVDVKTIEENKLIIFEWPVNNEPTTVEWIFTPLTADTTFVEITNKGTTATSDALVELAMGITAGFTMVLAATKALLEHGIILTLVADRFPAGK